ncbi:unnamed protein product [Periconia digitata]|uniref:Uncharacterized protein n=1 Tax=Periconia digitata TaxID=1303443 RepID=A0A9W4XUS5_9PLEO|nr:unnamed protein product [Periconia digitata]
MHHDISLVACRRICANAQAFPRVRNKNFESKMISSRSFREAPAESRSRDTKPE